MNPVNYKSHRSNSRKGSKRFFTPAEANRALVFVKRVARDIVSYYARLLDLHETIEAAQRSGKQAQFELARGQMVKTAQKLQQCLSELESVGVELKDWSDGIVDFPCMIGGRELRLCWVHGEQVVGHWHEVNEGFPQRQEISKLEAWELLPLIR